MKNIFFKVTALIIILILPVFNVFSFILQESTISAVNAVADITEINSDSGFSVNDVEKEIKLLREERQKADEEEQRIQEEKRLEEERRLNRENLMKQLENGDITYRQLFNGTLFVGDSLMHGLYSYGILDGASMITMVSASLYHLEGNISKIIANNPEKLVLHYGINMLVNTDSQLNWFIGMYTDIINELKSALPDTVIYISGIFNVAPSVEYKFPCVAKYNERLLQMCNELEVVFIDNSPVLPGDCSYYGSDGIHVSRAFYYDVWLPHMYYYLYC